MARYVKGHKCLVALTMLFSIVSSLVYVFIAVLLQNILDVATSGDLNRFISTLLFSLFYFLFLVVFTFLYTIFSKKVICCIMKSLREKVFAGIMNCNMQDFYKVNTADYLSSLTNDVKIIEDSYLLPFLETVQNGIIFLASLIVMFYFDVIVTLSVLLVIIVTLIVTNLFGTAMQNRQSQYSSKLSEFTNHTKDMLSGFETIKSYGIKPYIISKFKIYNEVTTNAKYSVEKLLAYNQSFSMALAILVQIVVIFLSAYFIIIGRTTFGALMGMVQLSSNLANPLLMIFSSVAKLKGVQPIIERLNKLSDYEDNSFTGVISPTYQNGLSTANLSFSYSNEKPALNDVSINICKGEKYAVVGKNGCGKTTLIKLLSGSYSNYRGNIYYDDIDISKLHYDKLMNLSAIINQDVYMFNESILDNICLHHEYSNDELRKALNISGVSQFTSQMADGLNTIVAENGANLSGGQKQRIAVARAIIQGKPILILDEGTSAIDMQTAYDIESCLLRMDGLTLITITHNLQEDNLARYSQIIYMDNGAVTDIGTFEELTKKQGGFYSFSQLHTNNQTA